MGIPYKCKLYMLNKINNRRIDMKMSWKIHLIFLFILYYQSI